MKRIQNDIAALRMFSHIVHGRGIDRTPAVDERRPIRLDAALLPPGGEVIDQTGAPIDNSAEDVEDQRPGSRRPERRGRFPPQCRSRGLDP